LGLVVRVSQDEVERYFTRKDLEAARVEFEINRWDVLASKYNNEPVLLVPVQHEKGQILFDTVNLDRLYKKDAAFLPMLIKDYEGKHVMRLLSSGCFPDIAFNLNLHEISEENVMPEYMRGIIQFADMAEKMEEIRRIQDFMINTVRLGREYKEIIQNLIDKNRYGDAGVLKDGRRFTIRQYLEHMAECPSLAEEVLQRNKESLYIYERIQSTKFDIASTSQQEENPLDRFVDSPVSLVPGGLKILERLYIERKDEKSLQHIEDSKTEVTSLKRQTGITDEEMSHLFDIAVYKDMEKDYLGFFWYDKTFYITLLNALILDKEGKIDMHSSAFKGLLKSLFPEKKDEILEKL